MTTPAQRWGQHEPLRNALAESEAQVRRIGQIRIALKPATLAETEGDSLP